MKKSSSIKIYLINKIRSTPFSSIQAKTKYRGGKKIKYLNVKSLTDITTVGENCRNNKKVGDILQTKGVRSGRR
jgi:hypothetical protein